MGHLTTLMSLVCTAMPEILYCLAGGSTGFTAFKSSALLLSLPFGFATFLLWWIASHLSLFLGLLPAKLLPALFPDVRTIPLKPNSGKRDSSRIDLSDTSYLLENLETKPLFSLFCWDSIDHLCFHISAHLPIHPFSHDLLNPSHNCDWQRWIK